MTAICLLGGGAPDVVCSYSGADISVEDVDRIKQQLGCGAERLVVQDCRLAGPVASRLGGALCYPHTSLRLTQLDLSGTRMGDVQIRAVLQALRLQPVLNRLSLAGCGIVDREGHIAMFIDSNPKLRHLLASGNTLAPSEAHLSRVLKRNASLETLDLSRCQLSCKIVEAVEVHPSLTALSVARNSLASCHPCRDLVLNCKPLRTLNVSYNRLPDIEVLVRNLCHSTQLRELNLCNTGLAAGDVPSLCTGLASSHVIALDVSCNPLTDAAAALLDPNVISEMRYLSLADTGLTQDSALAVSRFIEESESLTAICLDRTTSVDPMSLSDVLTRNRGLPLKALSIGHTKIKERGVLDILFCLREYTRLQSIVLDGLAMHSATFLQVAELLLQDKATVRLTQLSLNHNPIADIEGVDDAFRRLFERNPHLGCIHTRHTLMQGVSKVLRSQYPSAGPVEQRVMSSLVKTEALHDVAYSPSALFRGVSAVDL